MLFSEKWLRNHPQFLLHFMIHIDVLMLCRKFELIPTAISQVMAILKINQLVNTILSIIPNANIMYSMTPKLQQSTALLYPPKPADLIT